MRDVFEAPILELSRAQTEHGAGLLMLLVPKRVHDAKPMRHLRRFDHKEKRQAATRSASAAGRIVQSRFAFGRFVNDHKKLALVTFR